MQNKPSLKYVIIHAKEWFKVTLLKENQKEAIIFCTCQIQTEIKIYYRNSNLRHGYSFMQMSRLVAAERLRNYQIKWWSCVISNKRGRVSALLGPHRRALVRM